MIKLRQRKVGKKKRKENCQVLNELMIQRYCDSVFDRIVIN